MCDISAKTRHRTNIVSISLVSCVLLRMWGKIFTVTDLIIYVNWQRSKQSSDNKPRLFYGFNASCWLGSNLFSYKKYFWFNVTKPIILLDHTECTVSLLLTCYMSDIVVHALGLRWQCTTAVIKSIIAANPFCNIRHANSVPIFHWILLDEIVSWIHSFVQPPQNQALSQCWSPAGSPIDWAYHACSEGSDDMMIM